MRNIYVLFNLIVALICSAPAFADSFSAPMLTGLGVSVALKNSANVAGGVVLLNGSPVAGNLLQWTINGIQDSGISASNILLSNATTIPASFVTSSLTTVGTLTGLIIQSTSANAMAIGANGTTNPVLQVSSYNTNVATGIQILGAAAGGGVSINTLSPATNEALVINGKGASGVVLNAGFANYLGFYGAAAGNLPDIQAVGTDTNIRVGISGQGNKGVSLGFNGPNYVNVDPAATGKPPVYWTAGSDTNIGAAFQTKGTGSFLFQNNNFASPGTGLAINYQTAASTITGVSVTSKAAGSGVSVAATSSGTDENLTIDAKGAGTLSLQTAGTGNVILGASTHSGPALFTGAPSSFTANGQVQILGGTTVPTFNASAMNTIAVGGYYSSSGSLNLTSGGGSIFMTSNGYGMAIQANTISLLGPTGGIVASSTYNGLAVSSLLNTITGTLAFSGIAPTLTSGFGTVAGSIGVKNGTYRFDVNTNVGGTSGVIGLPAATTDWKCSAQSKNNPATLLVLQTGYATNSATFSPYTLSGTLDAWRASDVIAISCVAN